MNAFSDLLKATKKSSNVQVAKTIKLEPSKAPVIVQPAKPVAPRPSPATDVRATTSTGVHPNIRRQTEQVVREMLPSLIEAIESSLMERMSTMDILSPVEATSSFEAPSYKMSIVRGEDGKILEVQCEAIQK